MNPPLRRFLKNVLMPFGIAALTTTIALGAEGGFTDVTDSAGVTYMHFGDDPFENFEPVVMAGGVAIGDFDNDGWQDIFVTRLDNTDILFRNLGGERIAEDDPWFEDVTAEAGILLNLSTNGAAWGDIDNDGDLDLYITSIRSSRFHLYINDGTGHFTEDAISRGVDLESDMLHDGFSVVFGDYDKDGWLDIHTCEWGIDRNNPDISKHSVLLHNLGPENPGHFENVTEAAGVTAGSGDTLNTFASSFSDLDGDGWPDLVIAADYEASQIFWNNGDGTFTDGTEAALPVQGGNPMGSTIADFDEDGRLDWFITSIEDNRFYRNLGNRTFEEIAEQHTIHDGDWGWGAKFIDVENDGDYDLMMTNGHRNFPNTFGEDPMRLWTNNGLAQFDDRSEAFGIVDTKSGKGLATFDYDNDGDLDVFITNNNSTPTLYRNDINFENSWLRLKLNGTASNTRGIGALITLIEKEGDNPKILEITGENNYLSQSEAIAHFGLNKLDTPIFSVSITWPSGFVKTLKNVALNQLLGVDESYYDQWLFLNFSTEELEDNAVSGLNADPDKDGLSNLLEYALGTLPLDPHSLQDTIQLFPGNVSDDQTNHLITYHRSSNAIDISYVYETSENLIDWQVIGNSNTIEESIEPVDSTKVEVTIRIPQSQPIAPSLFLRIRAVQIK